MNQVEMDKIAVMTEEKREVYRKFKREYAIRCIMEHRTMTLDDATAYIDEHHSQCWTTRECPWMPWPPE